MKEVILYTTEYCPYCKKALRTLTQKGVDFTTIDVTSHQEEFRKIKLQTGWDSVPQIFIDGDFIGGCDDMHKLDEEGKLDLMLGL